MSYQSAVKTKNHSNFVQHHVSLFAVRRTVCISNISELYMNKAQNYTISSFLWIFCLKNLRVVKTTLKY